MICRDSRRLNCPHSLFFAWSPPTRGQQILGTRTQSTRNFAKLSFTFDAIAAPRGELFLG